MPKPTLTTQDIDTIKALDHAGDRTGAYVLLWQLTGSAEALRQARISSFSGADGGAAFGANLELQKELGSKYPGVFNLSQQVFKASIDNVGKNLKQINAGANIDPIIFQGAESAWDQAELPNGKTQSLKHDFPGNLFAFDPFSNNWLNGLEFSNGTGVALDGANNAILFGKSPADFAGQPGYSTHILKDYAGDELLTIKDDRTGKTVYVDTGGNWEQYLTDHAVIDARMAVHPGPNVAAMRQKFTLLRQHEEPGSISIDQHGGFRLISPAGKPNGHTGNGQKQQARGYKPSAVPKPILERIERHKMFLKAGQRHGSFGPVTSPGPGAAASPARREAALTVLLGQIAGHAAQNRFLRMAARGGAHGQMVSAAPTASTAFPSFAPRAATQSAGFAPSPPRRQVSASPAVSSLEALIASPPAFPQHLTFKQELELKNAVSDYFAQQARLPPNGYSGFDPRLSPAWPGLKTRH